MTLSLNTITVGQTFQEVLVDDLTRTQLVQYAGASGDYNPLHSDEVYATQVAGYPTVFAHGMLTMGMTARLLTDTLGNGRLLTYGGRFTAQVFPGDTLVAVARVESIETGGDHPVVTLGFETSNQDGTVVFAGQATGRIDP